MNANELTSIDQVRDFLSGTQRVAFEVAGDKRSRYHWIRRTLVKFNYSGCGKADKGILLRYLMKVSGYSRAQLTRLIKQYRDTGELTPRQRTVRGFARRYTKADIRQPPWPSTRWNSKSCTRVPWGRARRWSGAVMGMLASWC